MVKQLSSIFLQSMRMSFFSVAMIGYAGKQQLKGENGLIRLKVPERLQSITMAKAWSRRQSGRKKGDHISSAHRKQENRKQGQVIELKACPRDITSSIRGLPFIHSIIFPNNASSCVPIIQTNETIEDISYSNVYMHMLSHMYICVYMTKYYMTHKFINATKYRISIVVLMTSIVLFNLWHIIYFFSIIKDKLYSQSLRGQPYFS